MIRFFKKYEQIGTFCFEIDQFRNLSFIRFDFFVCFGLEKNAAFRFGFLNKINSVNFSILLSIGTYTFLNVFVSFRYRISSISKLYYRTFLFLQVGCRAGGMQDKRAVEQEGFRTGGVQDRRGVGQEGCRTGVMHENRDARK